MQYSINNAPSFPEGAVECARIVSNYDLTRKIFPEGAIEAARVLRESSDKKQKTVETKVA